MPSLPRSILDAKALFLEPVRTDLRSNSQTFLATFGDESEILGQ